ncbi:MAG: ATP-binding protein [Eubacteriales bacterium]|nr:ATP-binding protein [Eubacteriales bacterium]
MKNIEQLVYELVKLPAETAWLEFKHNNSDPKTIGEDISALANAAALFEKSCAYLVWGIDDASHNVVGTTFDWHTKKKGGEELENWLRHTLSENANYEFCSITIENMPIVVLTIYKALDKTVMFEKIDYIRIGSYTKKLNGYPEIKAQLWNRLCKMHFEGLLAKQGLSPDETLQLLDYSTYFDIKKEPLPTTAESILHYLLEEGIAERQDNGLYAITNLGAILFAKRLADFPGIVRKALRVVQYKDISKFQMLKEDTGTKGYASGFEGLIKYFEAFLPTSEVIKTALRETVTEYPILAIREAIANALIHQDFSLSGTGPLIEIFSNRIEITNPGIPLIDIRRIIDNPPKSRNEKLASLMRRLRMCEELGTGWDKIAMSCEMYQLPAPKIDLYEESTKVTLFAYTPYGSMSAEDKLRACYWHACLKQVCGEQMTNTSLRKRFGLEQSGTSSISRLIKDAVAANLLKPYDPDTAPRYMKYVPVWA